MKQAYDIANYTQTNLCTSKKWEETAFIINYC